MRDYAQTPVYLCVQNLRKLRDFDDILKTADPRSTWPGGVGRRRAAWHHRDTDEPTAEFSRAGSSASRCGSARQERAGYLRLVSCADVLLDTLHWLWRHGCRCWRVAHRWSRNPGDFTAVAGQVQSRPALGLVELVAVPQNNLLRWRSAWRAMNRSARAFPNDFRNFGAEWFIDPRPATELETFWLEQARR